MPFTPEFGGAFGQDLGSALASLIQQYGQKKQQRQQSQLLSQLLAPRGQQSVPGQLQAEGESVLPVPLGQVLAQAQAAGLGQDQLRLIEQEYKRREDQARQQRKESREDIRQLQKESRADYQEILREEGDYAKDIKGSYKTVPRIKNLLNKIIANADAAGPTNAIRPKALLSTETRNLDTDINALINIASENFKGRVTNARLSFLAAEKPDITMTPESLKYTAHKWLEDINELGQEFNIAQEIKKRNNGRIPRNYQNIVAEELQARRGSQEEQEFRSPQEPKNINQIPQQAIPVQQQQRPGIIQPQIPQQAQQQEEGLLGKVARLATGATTSALAGAAQVPSSLAGLGSAIYGLGSPERQFTPEQIQQFSPEQQQKIEEQRRLTEETDPFAKAERVLPTAESIKERAKEYLPEGYLEPKNDAERFIYDVGEDIGTLLFPLGKTAPIKNILKEAGYGNLAKYATKYLGGSEKLQEGAKLGTMLLTALRLQPSVKSKIDAYYDAVSTSPLVDSPIITKGINETMNEIERTFSGIGAPKSPSKKLVNEVISDWKKISPGNSSIIRDVWEFKKDLSDRYAQATAKELKRAKPALNKMQDSLNKALKNNPEIPSIIKDNLAEADLLTTGLYNSQKAQNFINKSLGEFGEKGSKYGIVPLMKQFLRKPIQTVGITAGAVGVAKTIGYAAKTYGAVKEILRNPAFFSAYIQFANSALKENRGTLVKSFLKMNKIAKKES